MQILKDTKYPAITLFIREANKSIFFTRGISVNLTFADIKM